MNKVKLGDIANITKLAGFEHTEYIQNNCSHQPKDNFIPLFIGKTISNGSIDKNFDWYISKEISNLLPRSKLDKKCLIVPYVGSVGDIAIFDGSYEAHLGSNVAKIEIVKKELYSENFLYYYIKSPIGQKRLLRDLQGGVQKNITMGAIRDIELPNVPLTEQEKMVAPLIVIDKKIQNNKKQIETLENLAKTIYDYWFVQFDFPNEEGKPYKSSGGKMVWNSELKREIPEESKVSTIEDANCYTSDYTANGSFAGLAENVKYNVGEKYARLIRIVDIANNFDENKAIFLDQNGYDYLSSCQLYGDEIIICNVGNVGLTFRCPMLNEKMALGPNGIVVKSKNLDHYLFMYFISSIGQQQIKSISSGSIQEKFNKTNFRKLKIFVPSDEVLFKFNKTIDSLHYRCIELWKENNILVNLKNELLPLLMNGQVSIR